MLGSIASALGLVDDSAADATKAGYAALSESQQQALNYLKEIDALPRQYREDAMNKLAMIYGFGKPKQQQRFYEGLENDPFYKQIMSTLGDREEAYLRGKSATGELRGGDSIMGLGNIAADTRNLAFSTAYQNQLGGIQSLLGLPDYTDSIYQGMLGIGQTQGQGIINTAQAQQDAEQAGIGSLLGIAKLATKVPWSSFIKPTTT